MIKETIHNIETDEITEIPFTAKELKEIAAKIEQDKVEAAAAEAEALAAAEARTAAEAKLAALGLTTDDLKALLG